MNDKMNHALDEVDNKYLSEVEGYRRRRRPHLLTVIIALALVILAVIAIPNKYGIPRPTTPTVHNSIEEVPDPSGIQSPDRWQLSNLVAAPEYPEMAQRPNQNDYADYKEYTALLNAWEESQAAQYDQPAGYAGSLFGFCRTSTALLLDTQKNSVFSPLNVYMALAMLAETTEGESRRQILQALPEKMTIDQLREQVGHIWNAHYCDDGVTTLLLGNSLWLDENYDFHQDTADLLAEHYYTASFRGDLGTDAMDQQLQAWLNANTGGLLQEQAENIKMDPDTVFTLASTVYFSAGWENEFLPQNTKEMTFHCSNYNLVTPFMRQTYIGTYYRGTNFGAVCLELSGGNKMWLILPDKNCTAYELTHHSEEYLRLTMDPDSWPKQSTYLIHLSLPKFDVVSEINLIDGLKQMGIRDVFNAAKADFTPLTDEPNLFISQASHAARVTVDEEGCLAAAFTVIAAPGSAPTRPPEMDFTLDRPFMFVISSRDNLPLFVGNVAEP